MAGEAGGGEEEYDGYDYGHGGYYQSGYGEEEGGWREGSDGEPYDDYAAQGERDDEKGGGLDCRIVDKSCAEPVDESGQGEKELSSISNEELRALCMSKIKDTKRGTLERLYRLLTTAEHGAA